MSILCASSSRFSLCTRYFSFSFNTVNSCSNFCTCRWYSFFLTILSCLRLCHLFITLYTLWLCHCRDLLVSIQDLGTLGCFRGSNSRLSLAGARLLETHHWCRLHSVCCHVNVMQLFVWLCNIWCHQVFWHCNCWKTARLQELQWTGSGLDKLSCAVQNAEWIAVNLDLNDLNLFLNTHPCTLMLQRLISEIS